jgi:GNAT superfamily N-acetyltransferase
MDRPTAAIHDIALRSEPAGDDGPRWVVAQAEAELAARYGSLDPSEHGLVPETFEPPAGAFLVARAGGATRPVGGVGVRRIGPATGEVRRLWVDPAWRGRGVGRALMDALEGAARRLGLRTLELGTGERQPEAVSLYASSGWERLRLDTEGRPLPASHIRFAKRLA